MPTRGASAGQVSRRRGWGRATVPGMEPEPEAPRRIDLLSIALLVFFLSLLVIVAALLMWPTVAR